MTIIGDRRVYWSGGRHYGATGGSKREFEGDPVRQRDRGVLEEEKPVPGTRSKRCAHFKIVVAEM